MIGKVAHRSQRELGARQPTARARTFFLSLASISILFVLWARTELYGIVHPSFSLETVRKCATDNVHDDLSFLYVAKPIRAHEFLERRDRLARALVASDADAFVLEPGYAFQYAPFLTCSFTCSQASTAYIIGRARYYGNVSQTDWEPWEPEERPFLMLILPTTSHSGVVSARTAFLAPHFEEGRVRMLGIPSHQDELDIVIWEEHWDPYVTLLDSHLFDGLNGPAQQRAPKLMMDDEVRDFISRGLASSGFDTVGLTPEAELVRQIKSAAEVEILRAVNTGTVAAVRAMRPCLVPGLTEDEVRHVLNHVLQYVGFDLFFNIVLFEENGALPHGGFIVGDKKVTEDTMIVIDVGAHYLGYSSDICRSFFIDPGRRTSWGSFASWSRPLASPLPTSLGLREEKLKIWDIVFRAQSAAASMLKPNRTAASVDVAARSIIEEAGYGECFTHRLGHGIGIKAHESPYLNKWNERVHLKPGMVFTNEPGIYLEGKFGVRHEDIYLIRPNGEAEILTGRRALSPYDP